MTFDPQGKETRPAPPRGDGADSPSLWRRLYVGWLRIAARFGHVQTLMILTLFYGILMGPIGVGIAIARRDLLGKRGLGSRGTAWLESDSAKPDLERAKLQS